MFLEEQVLNKIKKIAKDSPDKEVCGFVVYSENEILVKKCKNIHSDPFQFKIRSQDFLRIKNNYKILWIFHSHIESNSELSENDKIKSESLGYKFLVYSVLSDDFSFYTPKGYTNKYVGKNFNIGFNDCFSLLREYYFEEFGIKISDYPRSKFWKSNNPDLMISNFKNEGFYEIDSSEIRKNDVILIEDPRTNIVCHILIYLGNNEILHHPTDSKSIVESYSDKYKKVSKIFLRHV